MIAQYDITEQDAQTFTAAREFADQFEEAAKAAKSPKRVANLVQSELVFRLKANNLELEQSPITMRGIAVAADLADEGKLSSKQMKQLFDIAFEKGEDFPTVYEREKPQQISDTSTLEKMIDEIIAANPKQLEQYRGGKKTVAAFFVGQVMRLSKGQANPALLNELVTRKLDS
jgi:aspartyl-tRNA(Asn)/glutamyl-tRNA(Gln) amidotransferase subunit B